MFKQKQLKTKS